MKAVFLSAAALAAIVVAAAPALAQPQRGGGGGNNPSMFLAAKSVQEELKLSEETAKKITEGLAGIGRDVRGAERTEKTNKILAENLKPEQIKRLNQIMWQRGGVATAIGNSEVSSALKLTDDQNAKIKTIRDDAQKARQDAGMDRQKMQEIAKKMTDDITATLTDDQKKAWKELVGAEFKGEIPRPMRRNQ